MSKPARLAFSLAGGILKEKSNVKKQRLSRRWLLRSAKPISESENEN